MPKNTEAQQSNRQPVPPQPVTFRWFGQLWDVRAQLLSGLSMTGSVRNRFIWTPESLLHLRVDDSLRQAGRGSVRRESEEYQQALYPELTRLSGQYGTAFGYLMALSMIRANYAQVSSTSGTGRVIANHSMSMMPTFQQSNSPSLPSFSLALSRRAAERIQPLSPQATFMQRLRHQFASVRGYTDAHNDAYRDTGIDRHFTPWWLTQCVILGSGTFSSLPAPSFLPLTRIYGALTGRLALTFNPAEDYSTSDFLRRTGLYAAIAYPGTRMIPQLSMFVARCGPVQLRVVNILASTLLGGGYEFHCGYSHGTGYFKRAVDYFTFVDKEK